MRRRRRLQARFGVSGAAVPTATTDPSAADPGAADPTATTHLGAGPEAPSLERDLDDPAEDEPVIEIDLTDRTVYDSEITLESGDRLESGVVGPCLEVPVASDPAKPG